MIDRPPVADHQLHHVGGRGRGLSSTVEPQDQQVGHDDEQVDDGDQSDAEKECQRQLRWLSAHFGRHERRIIPAAVGIQHKDQCQAQAATAPRARGCQGTTRRTQHGGQEDPHESQRS